MLSVNINQFAYNTNDIVLKDINYNINPGEFIGLIGENGAGKSTTIKIILGLNEQQKDAVNIEKEKKLSYIPERPIIYEEMTLWEHIELCAASYHLKNWELEAERLVTLFNLKESVYKYPKKFSKGMQQKLMFILAYLPRPDFYIVDEPIMGLDPLSIKIILEMLQARSEEHTSELQSRGHLVCRLLLEKKNTYHAEEVRSILTVLHSGSVSQEFVQHLVQRWLISGS